MKLALSEPLHQWASCCVLLPSVKAEHPSLLKCVWQKGRRALHSDGRPPQHRGPHTSPQPANWGLAPQPRLLAPNPLPKSSPNLGGSPPLSSNPLSPSSDCRPSISPPPTRCQPPAFHAVSHGPRARPVLPWAERFEYQRDANIPAWRVFCLRDFL